MDFLAVVSDLADRLKAAGLNAGTDPRNVNPPGILVTAQAMTPARGKLCGPSMRAAVLLVARDSGDDTALEQLSALYAAAEPVLGRDLTSDDRPFERTVLPDSPAALPTLRLTVNLT